MELRRIILGNFWIKISAVLLSLILWVYIWGDRKTHNEIMGDVIQREFDNIPIAILKTPLSLLEITLTDTEVNAVIEGERSAVDKLDKNEITAYIEVRDLSPGVYHLPPVWKVPPGIKIAVYFPEFITVTVKDKRITEVKPLVESVPVKKELENLDSLKP